MPSLGTTIQSLKKGSTKAKAHIWLEIYAEFISQLSVLNINSEKDLDQVKTKTRSLEKEFKDIKARMNRTGEEGASRIKEKMEGNYILDQHLSERDSINLSKRKVLSSGFESSSANESFGILLMTPNLNIHHSLKGKP